MIKSEETMRGTRRKHVEKTRKWLVISSIKPHQSSLQISIPHQQSTASSNSSFNTLQLFSQNPKHQQLHQNAVLYSRLRPHHGRRRHRRSRRHPRGSHWRRQQRCLLCPEQPGLLQRSPELCCSGPRQQLQR